jgi:hypothetical protein
VPLQARSGGGARALAHLHWRARCARSVRRSLPRQLDTALPLLPLLLLLAGTTGFVAHEVAEGGLPPAPPPALPACVPKLRSALPLHPPRRAVPRPPTPTTRAPAGGFPQTPEADIWCWANMMLEMWFGQDKMGQARGELKTSYYATKHFADAGTELPPHLQLSEKLLAPMPMEVRDLIMPVLLNWHGSLAHLRPSAAQLLSTYPQLPEAPSPAADEARLRWRERALKQHLTSMDDD